MATSLEGRNLNTRKAKYVQGAFSPSPKIHRVQSPISSPEIEREHILVKQLEHSHDTHLPSFLVDSLLSPEDSPRQETAAGIAREPSNQASIPKPLNHLNVNSDQFCVWRGSPMVRARNRKNESVPSTSIPELPTEEESSPIPTAPPQPVLKYAHPTVHDSKVETDEQDMEKFSVAFFIWQYITILFSYFYGFLKFLYRFKPNKSEIKRYEKKMNESRSYSEWESAALQLDNLQGRDNWKHDKRCKYYDVQTIEYWLQYYQQLSSEKDYHSLIMALRSSLNRNIGGIANTRLFDYSLVGTKDLVLEYEEEVMKQLEYICDNQIDGFSLNKKLDFFYEVRKAYGKSALLLSGGATLGIFHIGVVKALYEENMLPQVISGTSAGSFVAALLCVLNDEELEKLFNPPFGNLSDFQDVNVFGKFKRLLRTGSFMDTEQFTGYLRSRLGDLTFKESYDKTKRILNISVASSRSFERPSLLNYISSPNVVIWSAVSASCALPLAFKAAELMCKDRNGNIVAYYPSHIKFRDGSIGADLPMSRLSELFNVNHFIVSQVNPHVAPFLRHTESKKGGFRSTLLYIIKSEIRHRTKQLAELGLVRGFLTTLEPILTQIYHGDVTIVPRFNLMNYVYLFSSPMDKYISVTIEEGRKNTFPKIPIIKSHCIIEHTLENCCESLKRQLYAQAASRKSKNMDILTPDTRLKISQLAA